MKLSRRLPFTVMFIVFCLILLSFASATVYSQGENTPTVTISGELKQWHRVTLTFDGPQSSEDATPNPFLDYRLTVMFTNSAEIYDVPGYFAADGDAANTGATSGNKWRVHFTPPATGTWFYVASFRTGTNVAISLDPNAGTPTSFNNLSGEFEVGESDKTGRDFRRHGMLRYVGEHYLQFAGSHEYYLKGGANSPENFLGYSDFDNTYATDPDKPFLHDYNTHVQDWTPDDPTWAGEKGKGIIGALNYLADQGMNTVYFITYNLDGGDGRDTWPWTEPDERERFDVSKLDQWEIVIAHMTALGLQLHFLTQENENDGALGELTTRRKLYYREMVARFSHHPALQWNIGEENSNTDAQRIAFAEYIRQLDPYDHPTTVHSFYNLGENFQDTGGDQTFYDDLLGNPYFESTSIQGDAVQDGVFQYNTWPIDLRQRSAAAGRPWVIYGDEQGPEVEADMNETNLRFLRERALWGNLMGGGGGVEWYFGYQPAENFGDLQSNDWRVAEPLWRYTRIALEFFHSYLPFWEMTPDNSIVSWRNAFALQKPGEVYAVFFFPTGNTPPRRVTLGGTETTYTVHWYDPRNGGNLQPGTITEVTGPGEVNIGEPPNNTGLDWVALIRAEGFQLTPIAPTETPVVTITETAAPTTETPTATDDSGSETPTQETPTAEPTTETPTDDPQPTTSTPEPTDGTPTDGTSTITPTPTLELPTGLVISGNLTEGNIWPTFAWDLPTDDSGIPYQPPYFNLVIGLQNGPVMLDEWFASADICTQNRCTVVTNSTMLPFGLLNGTYTWWIRYWLDDNTSGYVEGEPFTVTVPIAQVPDFGIDTTLGFPVLTFPADPGTTYIHLYIGTPDFQTVHFQWYPITQAVCDAVACVLKTAAYPINGDYVAYTQTWGPAGFNNGDPNVWSQPESFNLNFPAPVLVNGMTTTVENGEITFTWNKSEAAVWYQVWAGDGAPLSSPLVFDWYRLDTLGCDNSAVCRLTLENTPLPAGNIQWYIRAWGPGGFSTGGIGGWAIGPVFVL